MEVLPIKSLDDLLSWSLPEDMKVALESVIELQPRSEAISLNTGLSPVRPYKTLICHDHANGYHEDRFVNGSTDDSSYRFYHWSGIDTFIYFSHHMVTIPPCGWVQAAHMHGVKILGTFITEWEDGEKIWDAILASKEEIDRVTTRLVEVAVGYKFDGWLFNVECKIKPEKISFLLLFVEELHKKMHAANSEAEVIWYDSVTIEGNLDWQNELNLLNKAFFDCCDGIFLNYTWNEENLANSLQMAAERYIDVYVGLDVYGRNFYKGGGFNTSQALEVIRKYDLSAAIFAQAWTYEKLGSYNLFANGNEFWALMGPYLLYHGVTKMPLKSSFCQGFGKKFFFCGEVFTDETWFNLRSQNLQPLWEEISRIGKQCSISTDEAYHGGSCLSLWFDGQLESMRIFVCKVPITHPLKVTFVYRTHGNVDYVSICLNLEVKQGNLEPPRSVDISFICETSNEKEKLQINETVVAEESSEKNDWKKMTFYWENLFHKSTLKDCKLSCRGPGLVTMGYFAIEEN